uniref:CSON005504 protein n=1 Tax=Culicoides sonorensis TaxID=179676 RepID=A0A336L8U8_CULSO
MASLHTSNCLLILIVNLVLFCLISQVNGRSAIDNVLLRNSRAIISRELKKSVCGIQNYIGKIRGGLLTELDEFPWNALLIYEKTGGIMEHGCGGVLIDSHYVLTAAHCVTNQNIDRKGILRYVRLGEYNTDTEMDCIQEEGGLDCADEPMDIEVEKITIHPEYSQSSWDKHHDIAIIKLKRDAIYSDFIQPICLPKAGMNIDSVGNNLYVAGWGKTDLCNSETFHHTSFKIET